MKKTKIMYTCGTGWHHDPDYEVYDSVERLKQHKADCWEECGIVRLEITETEWAEEPNEELILENFKKKIEKGHCQMEHPDFYDKEVICDVCGRTTKEYSTISAVNLAGVVMCSGEMEADCKMLFGTQFELQIKADAQTKEKTK